MTTRKILTLVAALALAGCVNLAPDHQRPAAPVGESWPLPAASSGTAAQALAWQTYYSADARMAALIELALKNNRDLRVALLNVEQARALARVSDANRWPTISAGFVNSRTPGKDDTITGAYQAGLQINAYELDLFGKVKNQSDAASARYLASAEGARAAQIALIAAVASTHLALQADDEQLMLARSTAATRADSLRLMRQKYDAGAASALELAGSESALAAAQVALAAAERQRLQDENALVLLVGQPLPAALPAMGELKGLSPLPAGVPSEVLALRPDVLQAEAQLRAAEANIGAARAAFFPSIALTTSLGTASSQLSDLFSNTAWSFVGQMLMPIFDAGRNQANLASARAAQGIAVAQYEKAVQVAFREVADALAGSMTLDAQLQAQAQQAEAEQQRLKLVELRFANGASSSFELLDAQRASFAARQALVQVRLARALNSVQLYKALGGGAGKSS